MSHQRSSQGRLFGAILLIAGCCVGAAMLGLPVLTAIGGFRPTLFMFVLCWAFMATTGLLLLEVNLLFTDEVNIVSMASRTLGTLGKALAWVLFAFLFYSLMLAYVSGSGQLFSDFFQGAFQFTIPVWTGSLILCLLFGVFLYLGTSAVDLFNRLLMIGLISSYVVLVGMGIGHINMDYLLHTNWSASYYAIPVMITSFGFHNLIPSLTNYLNRDVKKMRLAILIGSAIPLLVYVMWEGLILGLVPLDGEGGFYAALIQGDMATHALKNAVGLSWIVHVAEYFAFFAIVTSFLSVALSFVDFLADGLALKKNVGGKITLSFLSLGPPFVFALIYPKIFLLALNYAGAFGAVVLFGILPACMVWSLRYTKKLDHSPLVPGGKTTLLLVIIFSLGVFSLELMHQLHQ